MDKKQEPGPGDGIRSLRSTGLFRAINYELYVRQNKSVMLFGLLAMLSCTGYILYMRYKHDGTVYYTAVDGNGSLTMKKKMSRWND